MVSNTMGNKSVIKDGYNGYLCRTAEDYAARIREAMENFPVEIPENAYKDVLNIYNTHEMKKKYVAFYNAVIDGTYQF